MCKKKKHLNKRFHYYNSTQNLKKNYGEFKISQVKTGKILN